LTFQRAVRHRYRLTKRHTCVKKAFMLQHYIFLLYQMPFSQFFSVANVNSISNPKIKRT